MFEIYKCGYIPCSTKTHTKQQIYIHHFSFYNMINILVQGNMLKYCYDTFCFQLFLTKPIVVMNVNTQYMSAVFFLH